MPRRRDFGEGGHAEAEEAGAAVMGGQHLAVRCEGKEGARDLARVGHLDRADFAECRQVPKLDGAIIAFGGEGPPVWRKHAIDKPGLMARKHGQFLSRDGIPQPRVAVPTGGGDGLLTGRKADGRDPVSMPFNSPDKTALGDVAEQASVANRERKEPAIAREFDGIGVSRQAFQAVNRMASARVENLDEPEIRQREAIAVGSRE